MDHGTHTPARSQFFMFASAICFTSIKILSTNHVFVKKKLYIYNVAKFNAKYSWCIFRGGYVDGDVRELD